MNYTQEELEAKSESQLAAIIKYMGIGNPETMSSASMIDAILKNSIETVAEAPAKKRRTKVEVAKAVKSAPVAKEPVIKKKRLIIHNQEGPEASTLVKVQVNGVMYTIPREKEVVVPEYVIGVLQNAVRTDYERVNGAYEERHSRRFPFTILGDAA